MMNGIVNPCILLPCLRPPTSGSRLAKSGPARARSIDLSSLPLLIPSSALNKRATRSIRLHSEVSPAGRTHPLPKLSSTAPGSIGPIGLSLAKSYSKCQVFKSGWIWAWRRKATRRGDGSTRHHSRPGHGWCMPRGATKLPALESFVGTDWCSEPISVG